MTITILGNNNNNPGNNNNNHSDNNNNPGNNNNQGNNNNNNNPGNNNNQGNNNGDNEVKPDPNRPTINLNVGGRYTINPYEYVNKEYSNKKLDFNIKNVSVATMSKSKDSNNNDVITFTGTGNGLTTATISSNNKKLYEIDIYVNDKNTTPSTNNLNPVKDNAASQKPDNNNNNNGNNNVDNEATPDMPTIKLNINGSYTINPYKYVNKDYKFKHLTFKYNNSAVANLEIDKQTRLAKITGKAEGNTIFYITSEGKDLYKINIDVKKDNQISATNLNPVRDNAAESDDNNNNNNPGNNNNQGNNNNNNPGNNNNQGNNNNNSGNNNNQNNNNNHGDNNNNPGNNNNNNNPGNNNNSGNIISNDNEQDPLVKAGYYTPKGETPKTPETPKEVDLSKNPTPKTPETPKNVDLSKNPNTPNKPGNITRKPNQIPRSGIDYAIYFALAGAIILGGVTLFKYIKLNKQISNKKK